MLWINQHKNAWRVAILVVALVAIMGPWNFELIHVPSEYSCSAPFIRLEDDFCGTPLSGATILTFVVGAFLSMSVRLVTGTTVLPDQSREFLITLCLMVGIFLLLLPFFSTLLLILRGDRRGRQAFNVAAWGLAAGIGLLIGISWYPRMFWVAWGIWLYVGSAAGALILEVLTLAARRRKSQG